MLGPAQKAPDCMMGRLLFLSLNCILLHNTHESMTCQTHAQSRCWHALL